jgi:hypothetical protein
MKSLVMMLAILMVGMTLTNPQKSRNPRKAATTREDVSIPEIESTYDRFKDRTTLSFSREVFGSAKNPPVLLLGIATFFSGQTPPHETPPIILTLAIIGGTSRTRDPELLAIIDGERISFGRLKSDEEEIFSLIMYGNRPGDYAQISKLASAKKVEMRFGENGICP